LILPSSLMRAVRVLSNLTQRREVAKIVLLTFASLRDSLFGRGHGDLGTCSKSQSHTPCEPFICG
jgi:hypothetical protein